MTDPTPTRAEVEAQRRAVSFLRSQHAQICFERGDHKDEVDTPWSRGADAIEQCAALRERAEAAEAERDRQYDENVNRIAMQARAENERDAARRAEAAAWNDAIEAAEAAYAHGFAAIRALRRAAPTEGEAQSLDDTTRAVLDRAERIVAGQSQQEQCTAEIFLRPTEGEA